ncbi:hypothetical protein WN943_005292 [Citrus x changshan-huyou]
MAVAPNAITYDFESVLYEITPENPPTNPSPNNPCLIIQLRYTHQWKLKLQSDDDDDFIENITPEFRFLLCIPLDRLNEDNYISHILERDYGVHLQSCECNYLKAQISDFAAPLLLAKSNIRHQVIEMVVVLQVTKVECINDELTGEGSNQDLMECSGDNFDSFVSV